jgi:predicted ArsR family transcriptional regulator
LRSVDLISGASAVTSTLRPDGCALPAATQRYPEACNAMESLFREFTGLAVTKCCERDERSRCCFLVDA